MSSLFSLSHFANSPSFSFSQGRNSSFKNTPSALANSDTIGINAFITFPILFSISRTVPIAPSSVFADSLPVTILKKCLSFSVHSSINSGLLSFRYFVHSFTFSVALSKASTIFSPTSLTIGDNTPS